MKRAKVGDVYAVKVPNGYKLYQWAYSIPKKGDYIRVFPGLYEEIPENVAEIAAGPHQYIISFYSSRAYRIGLAQRIDNFPVPDEYPFPDYMFRFSQDMKGRIFRITLTGTKGTLGDWASFDVSHMKDLPPQYRDIKLVNSSVTPNWLLYLFDIDFDLSDLTRFYPGLPGEDFAAKVQKYTDIVEEALERDRARREQSRISRQAKKAGHPNE